MVGPVGPAGADGMDGAGRRWTALDGADWHGLARLAWTARLVLLARLVCWRAGPAGAAGSDAEVGDLQTQLNALTERVTALEDEEMPPEFAAGMATRTAC